MYNKGDFHLHTNASDGLLTPTELVEGANKKQLDIMAITDHDTTKALDEGLKHGEKFNIKVIPGIELSTIHNEENIHLLGYFKDTAFKSEKFQSFLLSMKEYRTNRGIKIVDNLKTYFNINLDSSKLINETKGIIARPHIAKAIIEAGYDYDYEFIFNNIINKNSPAYVPNQIITLGDGINILREANALIVLAHPVLIKKTPLEELMAYDIDGIEAIYPLNTEELTTMYINTAKKYNKIITAGSDFHGISKEDQKHGAIGCNPLTSDYINIFLDKLKNC